MRGTSAAAVAAALALPAALALAAGPARAADPAPSPKPAATAPPAAASALLTRKIDDAIAAATSYRVMVQGPSGLTLDIREFGPDRVRIASNGPSGPAESIVIGTAMYYRQADGAWRAYPVPPIKHVRMNRLYMGAPDTLLEPLPDRTDGTGTALGAFRGNAVGNGQVPGTMECVYDKETFRPRTCTVTLQGLPAPLQISYAGWDDPANAVEPPAGVSAPPPPSPAPSPSPRAGS
jgi:hypothetical protein